MYTVSMYIDVCTYFLCIYFCTYINTVHLGTRGNIEWMALDLYDVELSTTGHPLYGDIVDTKLGILRLLMSRCF